MKTRSFTQYRRLSFESIESRILFSVDPSMTLLPIEIELDTATFITGTDSLPGPIAIQSVDID